MPWENTEQYIRSGHRDVAEFQTDTLKTITLNEKEGIKAIVGKQKGKHTMEVVSYLFEKDKGWTMEKAKEWFEKHHTPTKEHVYAVLPFAIAEKMLQKPLRIRGIAMTVGMSRNFNIYTPDEIEAFSAKLAGAPVYIEHVTAENAVGKVTKTEWDRQRLWYNAEIYDEEIAEKIRRGLIRHVSVGADYETIDIVDGKVPHGLCNAEISLVAVPGITETNIQILESLQVKEQSAEPIITGEYILGFYQDASAFMPEHLRLVWHDRKHTELQRGSSRVALACTWYPACWRGGIIQTRSGIGHEREPTGGGDSVWQYGAAAGRRNRAPCASGLHQRGKQFRDATAELGRQIQP